MQRAHRGRVTTPAQDRAIARTHIRDRKLPASRTAATTIGLHGRPVSPQTVVNRLNERGLNARRPNVGPVLTNRHRQARQQWCNAHVRWNQRQWGEVLFSDESRFSLQNSDGRTRVYRRVGERYLDACVVERNRFQRSVMVWGGIKSDRKFGLVIIRGNMNAQRYQNDVLRPVVVPYVNNRRGNVVFQQDNARPHVAAATMQYLQQNNVQVLDWPAVSPDLSPIEHVWDLLDRRVRQRPVQPQTLQQLEQALIQEWNNITLNEIRPYIRSMRRRCRAIINSRGGHVRY